MQVYSILDMPPVRQYSIGGKIAGGGHLKIVKQSWLLSNVFFVFDFDYRPV